MENIDLLISARWILPIAPENKILEAHTLAIRGEYIVALLPLDEAKEKYHAEQYLNLKNHVLMPGLINAHTHTPMNLFRGLADDLQLFHWLQKYIWPAERTLINNKFVRDGTQLAIAEMLRGGTTCFNDHYFLHNTIAETAHKSGIRACVGILIMNVPTKWAKDEKTYLTCAEKTLLQKEHRSLITWTLAPHAPYTISDTALMQIEKLSDQYDLPIHMHLHETRDEIAQGLKEYGKRPLTRLHKLGLLSHRLIAVHMTQLTSEEIELLYHKRINVVHCPESNLKLASGIAPVVQLLKAGINVAIGTDSAASNNDLDLFGEMRTAAFVAKILNTDPTQLLAAEVIKMATLNGAKALGLGDKVGSLEAGKFADIIAMDLSSFLTQPVFNPMSHLVYAMSRLQVSDVWVAGKQLLREGKFTKLDIKRILEDSSKWTEKVLPFKAVAELETVNCVM
ncbi:TRZ/ATZ family hydrolase [Coxiella endosymbiont of Amblyomma nuttalli]|uniref:TRZ/ATZ family hydrolase n=1 Tax=Coxiella endosymbiont of Amblyomma nuttalli TaxID=2749996 RepID=UPI001BABB79F|nr:TRZ/ATZ family hydrolase [Coxiella endosymbiont of Amblyomma nuttalli]QTS83868.1 5-methylthioadenosine/S-adenosylhomocysteine deaminase [Coxiella endosymbiont of Amblyomma nuttalli]